MAQGGRRGGGEGGEWEISAIVQTFKKYIFKGEKKEVVPQSSLRKPTKTFANITFGGL